MKTIFKATLVQLKRKVGASPMQGQPETARIQISQNDLEESRENYRYMREDG